MRRFACLLSVFLLSSLAHFPALRAQAPDARERLSQLAGTEAGAWTEQQLAIMARLRDAALDDKWGMAELRHLTDNIGPRLAGSPEAQQAVEWVAAEMRSLGAEVTLEPAKVPHWVRGEERAELVAWHGQTPGRTRKLFVTALGPSVATPPEGITAQVVVVRDFAELVRLPEGAVKGKILVFNHPFDRQLAAAGQGGAAYGGAVIYRGEGPVAGALAGAVAVLVRSAGGAEFRLPHTGMTDYDPKVEKIPAGALAAEDAELVANLARQGPVTLHLTLTPQTLPDADSFNVIADWKGSEHPEQVVIVSGHLDSWDLGGGAIDDGTGITVSMQAIYLMKQLGIRPRRTIRFVAWMCEEQGSQGGEAYAHDYKDQIANHIAALESDGGPGHPTGIFAAGTPRLRQWIRPVARVLEPIGAGRVLEAGGVGEDVEGLTEKGVPSFAPNADSRFYFDYHHTAADTWDKVDPRQMNENAAVMTVLAYALADAVETAPR